MVQVRPATQPTLPVKPIPAHCAYSRFGPTPTLEDVALALELVVVVGEEVVEGLDVVDEEEEDDNDDEDEDEDDEDDDDEDEVEVLEVELAVADVTIEVADAIALVAADVPGKHTGP